MTLHPKVQNAGIAGALTVVLVWAATLLGVEVPPEVASAITTILSFAAGFITKS